MAVQGLKSNDKQVNTVDAFWTVILDAPIQETLQLLIISQAILRGDPGSQAREATHHFVYRSPTPAWPVLGNEVTTLRFIIHSTYVIPENIAKRTLRG
ncbi:hypothetical protein ANO14919_040220 [Xylariales sp. No.14919]|nr:hypothetical protein ANO14919_040220 [Xylariales sp. No.14919]